MQIEQTEDYKEFVKLVLQLGRRYEVSRVFSDFLTLAICSFHVENMKTGGAKNDEEAEALYMKTIGRYKKEEVREVFPKLLGLLMLNAQKRPYSDILGSFFTEHVSMGHNGQFFTPDSICQMLAELTDKKEDKKAEEKPKTIYDPASGSGRMLLSAAEANPKNLFFANDVSETCAKMTALNFFINGLRGEVAWMNSLTLEWFGAWKVHYPQYGILPIEKEQSVVFNQATKEETKKPDLPSEKQNKKSPPGNQLSLF